MPSKKKSWRPGEQSDKDLDLYVIDSQGNHLGEISVAAGHRIPPTRIENAEGYIEK